ncbi:hypothetical protein D3C79_926260 [compost metagenome]
MQQRTLCTYALANGCEVGHGAQFVVDCHQRDQAGIGTPCRLHGIGLDQAGRICCQASDGPALTLQFSDCIEYGLVFQLAGNQVAWVADALGDAFECKVVGLGSA